MKRFLLLTLAALVLCATPVRAQQTITASNPTTGLPEAVQTDGAGGLKAGLATGTNTVGKVSDITTSVTPGGAAANLGKAEDAAHASGDTGVLALMVRKDTATQSTNADADYSAPAVDAYSTQFVRHDHPNRITCPLPVSTATTLTALGGSCATPGAGLSIYITDIILSTNASGIAADSFLTLKSGTGGSCGTATAVIWGAFTPAAAQASVVQTFATPIKVTANSEVCWMNTTAGSKMGVVNGFIAP